jgi:hypothetical protein
MTSISLKFNKGDFAFFVKGPSEIHKVQIKSTEIKIVTVTPEISYTSEDGRVFAEKDLLTKDQLIEVI